MTYYARNFNYVGVYVLIINVAFEASIPLPGITQLLTHMIPGTVTICFQNAHIEFYNLKHCISKPS